MDSELEKLLCSVAVAGDELVKDLGTLKLRVTNSANRSEPSPLDGAPRLSKTSWEAPQRIITSCQELITILTPTRQKLLEDAVAVSTSAALGIACHLGVADVIQEIGGGSQGVGIQAMARKIGTGDTKLASTMRVLTATGTFAECPDGLFYNNRLSDGLRSDINPGAKEMLETYAIFSGRATLSGLLPVMLDPARMNSIAAPDSAFCEAYNTHLNSIEYCMQPENSEQLTKLMAGFPWLTEFVAAESVQNFNWSKWGREATICDMGCGDGGIMALVKDKERDLKIVCQELESVVPMVLQKFESRLPGAISRGSVEVQVHDYFKIQEVDADVYWMRGVLHDYSDDDCRRILANLKPCLAKNPAARVLINEIVVPCKVAKAKKSRDRLATEARQSSFPRMTSLMQLQTTSLLEGFERTHREWEGLFENAGFEIKEFYSLRIFTSIYELGLKV